MQFPNLSRVESRSQRPTQPFVVQPGLGQAGPSSFPQNLPFKLGVLRRTAIRRLCGVRDYAKPARSSYAVADVSVIWDSA